MKLNEQIVSMVRAKIKLSLTHASDFSMLRTDIFKETHENLGLNTLKRLFGQLKGGTPKLTTLDIIARYLGRASWQELNREFCGFVAPDGQVADTIFPSDLPAGTRLRLAYNPGCSLHIEVCPDGRCKVLDQNGTLLLPGDLLEVCSLTRGAHFCAKTLVRAGLATEPYTGGDEEGVKEIRVEKNAEV